MKNLILVLFIAFLATRCSAQQSTSQNDNRLSQRGGRQEAPSIDEIFKMDTNKDGKLAKSEIKGPLLRDFSKIDSNEDGFISRKELENAPKPEKRQRPPRNNQ